MARTILASVLHRVLHMAAMYKWRAYSSVPRLQVEWPTRAKFGVDDAAEVAWNVRQGVRLEMLQSVGVRSCRKIAR